MRQVVLLATCLLLTAGLLAGCADGDTKDTMDITDRTEKTWDLREPPTRQQVGMKDDEDDVFALYDTDKPHQVSLKLPENTTLTLPLVLLTFDSYGRDPSSDNRDPTGLDGKTDRVPLDETVELYRSTLDQLNMPTDTIADFQQQATAADGTEHPAERIKSRASTKRIGYIELQLHAEYEPDNQVGFIQFSGAWGPLLHD